MSRIETWLGCCPYPNPGKPVVTDEFTVPAHARDWVIHTEYWPDGIHIFLREKADDTK